MSILWLLLPLLQAAPAKPAADVVHTRDGKKYEGRLVEYDLFLEVEAADGKKSRHLRLDVTRVELAPNFIRFPELIPFPPNVLDKLVVDFHSSRRLLVAVARHPSTKIIGIDLITATRVWEIDVPNRVGEIVIQGPRLYVMQREKLLDDAKKVKIGGTPVPKEIHKLTVTCIDLQSGETAWKFVMDNNDRRDLFWEFVNSAVPALWVFPDRVLVYARKTGYPMDNNSNVDKDKPKPFASFVPYDPEKKAALKGFDSPEGAELIGVPVVTNDLAVFPTSVDRTKMKILAISSKDGKARWTSDPFPFPAKIHDATEEYVYVADKTTLFAHAAKTGKRVENWAIDLSAGSVVGYDASHVYFNRDRVAPFAIIAYDARKGTESWKINLGEKVEAKQVFFSHHRLIYVNRLASVFAWDTVQKKELWSSISPLNSMILNVKLMGSCISFYREGRIQMLDLETGQRLWAVRSPTPQVSQFKNITQIGEVGMLVHKTVSMDILRERKLPPGAAFFSPNGTPLCYALDEEAWSPPAFGPEAAYTLSTSGFLAAVKKEDQTLVWNSRVYAGGIAAAAPPVVQKGKIGVRLVTETVVFNSDGKTKSYALKQDVPRNFKPGEMAGPGIITASRQGLAYTTFETGEAAWTCALSPILNYSVQGENAWVLMQDGLVPVDLRNGAAGDKWALPAGCTSAVMDGKRAFVAYGPFGFGTATPSADFQFHFKTKNKDSRLIQHRTAGAIALAEGHVIYAHADGEVGGFTAADGKPVWTHPAPKFTSSFLVHGGRVWFAAAGAGLFGLNPKTGAVEWKLEIPEADTFTPIVMDEKAAFWSSDGWLIKPQ